MNNKVLTYLGCDAQFNEASTVVFGAPFDSTTSFRPGTRFASTNIRTESWGLETFSPKQERDLADYNIFDAGDLELPLGNTQKSLAIIEEFSEEILVTMKKLVMIGGEHLVTLGAVRAAIKHYPDLHIIHFDAHADLRDTYMDEKLSHATVLRRCWELVGDNRIYQFGIRSGSKDELKWAQDHVKTQMFNLNGIEEVIHDLKEIPIYLTVDLDVLDPSVFPGTGTPEPGGVTFNELHEKLLKMDKLNIIGCDINELSPHYDQTGASTAVAAKILRELLLILQ